MSAVAYTSKIRLARRKRVVLTHLHVDHDGGLAHSPNTEILVSPGDLRAARGWMGRLREYLPNRWPTWFAPKSLDLAPRNLGCSQPANA